MPTFRLDPVDLSHPDWKASTHKAPVVIQAGDEEEVRLRAKLAWSIAANELGQDVCFCPWDTPERVMCTQLDGDDGPPTFIEPEYSGVEVTIDLLQTPINK